MSGGISIHQIGIDDHLRLYDTKESAKNYLRYSTKTWKRWFENGVQYHNRLQKADYEQKFRDVGFELLDEWAERCSIDGLPINNEWDRYTEDDLRTTILTLVLRKPGAYDLRFADFISQFRRLVLFVEKTNAEIPIFNFKYHFFRCKA